MNIGKDKSIKVSGPVKVSLKQQTVSGVKWQMVNKIAQKVLSVGTFAVLARILNPSTFGLFAMAFILIDGLHLLKSFGLDTALIQRRDNIEEASHTAYFIVQVQGFVLFGICFLVAPLAGFFFKNPDITAIVRALGIIFIFSSFSKIPTTLLTKQMKFNTIAAIDLIGAVVNSCVAVALAFVWKNVWALVWAYVAKQFVTALLARFFSGYRFKWSFNWKIAKELLHYGKFMVGMGALWYFGDNVGNLIVGKMLGTAILGYFALATNIGNLINTHFTYLLEGVMLPAYSSIQHDKEEVKRVYLKTTKFVAILSMPFAVALIFLAKNLVLVLYGKKWLEVVPLIQIYGVMQLMVPILACSGSLFLGCGKPKFLYHLSWVGLLIKLPLLFILTKYFGVIGTVTAGFLVVVITLPLNFLMVSRIVNLKTTEFLKQFLPSLCCSLAMLAVIFVFKTAIISNSIPCFLGSQLVELAIYAIFGFGAYLAAFYLFDRSAAIEVKQLLIKKKI